MKSRPSIISIVLAGFTLSLFIQNVISADPITVTISSQTSNSVNSAADPFNSKYHQKIQVGCCNGGSAEISRFISGRFTNYVITGRRLSNEGDPGVVSGQSEVSQMLTTKRSWQYLPVEAYPLSITYNLDKVANLKLSPSTLAQIFTGKITNWSDPRISHDYGKQLPSQVITPVIPSGGSNASLLFTTFLASEANAYWKPFAEINGFSGSVGTQNFPCSTGFICGGADFLRTKTGTISFGEGDLSASYSVVAIRNKSGHDILPTIKNVTISMQNATFNSRNFLNNQSVYRNKDSRAYPILGVRYLITTAPLTPGSSGFSPPEGEPIPSIAAAQEGQVVAKFLKYFACDWQLSPAFPSNSIKLSKSMVSIIYNGLSKIPGHPSLKPLTKSTCAAFR